MNEEIETAVNNGVKLYEKFCDQQNEYTARTCQLHFTILKLLIGQQHFDELPCFVRILDKCTKFLNSLNNKNNKNVVTTTYVYEM